MNVASLLRSSADGTFVVGTIHSIDDLGVPRVRFPGLVEPTVAKTLIQLDDKHKAINAPVLLFLGCAATDTPLIVGVIGDQIVDDSPAGQPDATISTANQPGTALYADGKKIGLDAHKEILLTCGDSSIRLERNGKITIKGRNIVSRASASNNVKGASVKIN